MGWLQSFWKWVNDEEKDEVGEGDNMQRQPDFQAKLNQDFEKRWSEFISDVGDPEKYMKGEIKEACREFHKRNINHSGGWK